jgi:exosortase/archaeosortase family protein
VEWTYLWLFRHRLRFPNALVLRPVGTAIIWLANAVRIAAPVAIGPAGWQAVAEGGFHSQAGWPAFNAVALGLMFVSDRIGFIRAAGSAADSATPAEVGPAAAHTNPAAYRGYLTPRLQAAAFAEVPLGRFSWPSFFSSSVLVGALHGRSWLPGIQADLLFARALYRRGLRGDAVIAHATANGLIAVCGITGFSPFDWRVPVSPGTAWSVPGLIKGAKT